MRRWMLLVSLAAGGCGAAEREGARVEPEATSPATPLDSTRVTYTITGFEGPEAVRFDAEQRVWFVANFGASGDDARDANGYVSRVRDDGTVESTRFMTGTAAAPLHQPRGMFIEGDTLWVADVDGVHGFHRRTGAHLAFIDLRTLEPGFLNDVAITPGGTLYVTDTGRGAVYVGDGAAPRILVDSLVPPANGITWDATSQRLLLAPWDTGRPPLRALSPNGSVSHVLTLPAGRADGIEVTAAGILVATQTDSSLWLIGDPPLRIVRTRGRPADIGWDAARRRVAVPYIALNRVDVWTLP